jgi:hypothetical protein
MPPIRTPLGQIDGNRQPNAELSPYERGRIEGARLAGMAPREIEVELKQSRGAVRRTLDLANSRSNGASLSRSGRPIVYSIREKRMMLRSLRIYPKLTFAQRREDCGTEMSNTSIKNLARANNITHWKAKKRPALTEEHAGLRLLWCKCRAHWSVERWRSYMFSDECSAERGKGKAVEWVWGTPSDKWKPEMVTTYNKGKDIRVMVWAAFWGYAQRTKLFIMDRDFESKKHGYSANSYIEVLEARVLEHYTEDLIFMQDNAPIHTARKVTEWFENHGVYTTDWPPYSPDLNPIENAWWALKKKVMELFPELEFATGETEQDIKNLEEALTKAWDMLDDGLFESLVESMPRRIAACIKADGWHTKY